MKQISIALLQHTSLSESYNGLTRIVALEKLRVKGCVEEPLFPCFHKAIMMMIRIVCCIRTINIYICYKASSAAVRTDQWYKYISRSNASTSNINHHQLQYALINGINIYLCWAFRLLIYVIINCSTH